MKKNKKTLTLVVILSLVLLAGVICLGYYQDRQKFIEATKDIDAVADLFNSSSIKNKQQYCQRNNLKYEKGSLLCTIEASLTVNPSLYDNQSLIKLAQSADWQYQGSNLDSWQSADRAYIYAQLYNHQGMSCFIRVKSQDTKDIVTVGCYAPSKAEWYPVSNE